MRQVVIYPSKDGYWVARNRQVAERRFAFVWLSLWVTLLLVGCGGQPTPTVTQTLSDADLLKKAIQSMNDAKSLQFAVKESIPEMDVSPAEGVFVSPNKARGVSTKANGEQVEWIWYDGGYFRRQPDTHVYQLESTGTPSGAFLDFGLLTSIEPHIESITDEGEQEVDGVATRHMRVVFDAKALPIMPPQSSGKARFDAWVEGETGYIRKIGLSTFDAEQPPLVFTYYSKFDEPVSPPIDNPWIALTPQTTP